jgi:hypothetical protein
MTNRDVIEMAGGVAAVAKRFDKAPEYVQRLQYSGKLAASWYFALCDMTGQALPRHLFSFKGL